MSKFQVAYGQVPLDQLSSGARVFTEYRPSARSQEGLSGGVMGLGSEPRH